MPVDEVSIGLWGVLGGSGSGYELKPVIKKKFINCLILSSFLNVPDPSSSSSSSIPLPDPLPLSGSTSSVSSVIENYHS